MKILIITTLLLASSLSAQAQNHINFGVQAGLFANDQYYENIQIDRPIVPGAYRATKKSDNRYPAIGYSFGAVAQYSLTNNLAVGVNLSWYHTRSTNKHENTFLDGNGETYISEEQYRFQYVQLPLWFQYSLTKFKMRPYIRSGPVYTYRLHSKLDISTIYQDNIGTLLSSRQNYTRDLDTPLAYNGSFPRHDWQLMFELGISVSNHFKLGIRYDFLAPQRNIIELGPNDGGTYRSFRNQNVGLLSTIIF